MAFGVHDVKSLTADNAEGKLPEQQNPQRQI
jgi:hypothetical protein